MKLHKIGRFAGILTLIIFSINTSVDLVAQPVDLPDSFHTYTIGQFCSSAKWLAFLP